MNAGIQMLLVALLLGWSLGVMLRRWFPAGTAALQERLADRAAARGLARVAHWLRPVAASGGCDAGCSRCQSKCSDVATAQPVQWRPSSSSGAGP